MAPPYVTKPKPPVATIGKPGAKTRKDVSTGTRANLRKKILTSHKRKASRTTARVSAPTGPPRGNNKVQDLTGGKVVSDYNKKRKV